MEKEELEIPESSFNQIKGRVSESFIISKLVKEGYKVRKIVRRGLNINPQGEIKSCSNYFNYNSLKNLLKDYSGNAEEFLKMLEQNLVGAPDFLCLKDNKIIFVEVKAEHAGLADSQKKTFQELKERGFEVQVRRVKINLDLKEVVPSDL
jgi:hypothetical protein